MKLKTICVKEVNAYIKEILDNDFILNNISVKGEISNLNYHSSGHIYFSLKDNYSKINCIMFKNNSLNLDFKLKEGIEVVILGKVSVYSVNGTFQIYCNEIICNGIGDLHLEFENLKKDLSSKGYFLDKYKKKIPDDITKVGVVTAKTGAVIHDIKNVIKRRNKFIDIVLYPAKVQGNDAYKEIIKGINYFNEFKSVDVIIIGRGGGSIEELWNFNEEDLALAIFNSEIPIVSAVGHEVDFTISDFVSDIRASTPSQAGEIVSKVTTDIFLKLENYNNDLNNIMINKLSSFKNELKYCEKALSLNSPQNKIKNSFLEIDALKQKINFLMRNIIEVNKNDLMLKNNKLMSNNPINILDKGYALVKKENTIVNDINDINDIEVLEIILRNGSLKGEFCIFEKDSSIH